MEEALDFFFSGDWSEWTELFRLLALLLRRRRRPEDSSESAGRGENSSSKRAQDEDRRMLGCRIELLANVEKIDVDSFAGAVERGTEAR